MNLIKKHEGLRLTAYFDPVGVPTIGWGHTATVTREDVLAGKTITLAEAERLFEDDIKAASYAAIAVTGLSSGPYAAIAVTGLSSGPVHEGVTSFVFNLGPGALHGSKTQIGRHLMDKNYNKAYLGMQKYVYAGGRRLRGLVTRRKEEGELVLLGNKSNATTKFNASK